MIKLKNSVFLVLLTLTSFAEAGSLFGLSEEEEIEANRFTRAHPPVFFSTAVSNVQLIFHNSENNDIGGLKLDPAALKIGGYDFIGNASSSSDDLQFTLKSDTLEKKFTISPSDKELNLEHEGYEIKISSLLKANFDVLYKDFYNRNPTAVYFIKVESIKKAATDRGNANENNADLKKANKDNNMLRRLATVSFRTNTFQDSFKKESIAVGADGKVLNVGGEDVKLMYDGNTKFSPAKFTHDKYAVAGLAAESNLGQIVVTIGTFSQDYLIPRSGGVVEDTIVLSDGFPYAIKIKFQKEKGTWMLYSKGSDLSPTDAYLISVESIKKITGPNAAAEKQKAEERQRKQAEEKSKQQEAKDKADKEFEAAQKKSQEIKEKFEAILALQELAQQAQAVAEGTQNLAEAEKALSEAQQAASAARVIFSEIPDHQLAKESLDFTELSVTKTIEAVQKLRVAETEEEKAARQKAADEAERQRLAAEESARQQVAAEEAARQKAADEEIAKKKAAEEAVKPKAPEAPRQETLEEKRARRGARVR